MKEIHRNKIYNKALSHWGINAQYIALAEECMELGQAALRLANGKDSGFDNFLEEMMDVEILLELFKLNFSAREDDMILTKDEKLIRLKGILIIQGAYESEIAR